ncbi:MAG: hypothetical protein HC856_10800 [Pseudanabaena sp. RU_4_16]|nr:hypothetical protein [Pseudanabaena sp. RU_4_16]
MTQAIEISEVLKRLDSIQSDIQDIKLSQARTEEQIKATDQRIGDLDKSLGKRIDDLDKSLGKRMDSLETRGNAQETRFWGMVTLLATALLGILGKVIFFPIDKV